jgi:1,2-diacylglycerol-3-alpha-glucose alpha-1,2-galactosyltransferase
MLTINMRSSANSVKSQGVGSCYDEQVGLVQEGLTGFIISENKKGRFDLVHYHTVNIHYYFERLLNRYSTVGIGYVHFLPETLDKSLKLPGFARKVFYKYLLAFYNSMDYLVTVNPYFVQRIRSYGINHPHVLCIPNYVSSKSFFPMSKEVTRASRLQYDIPLNKFVVLGVGQLQTRKGVFDFVETAKKMPDIHFMWAGGFSFGRISDGYEEIKKLLANPPENVSFLGILEREDMPAVYNMADIMFLPSYDELFPMSILEALCCKKPVLVRDLPLYSDILFDYCMKGQNTDEFAAFIQIIANDAPVYNQWCEKSWECHQLYSEESVLRQWTRFYHHAYTSSKKEKENSRKRRWSKG